ncbi:MAG: hypothetical protein RL011_582 [Pseudomonadota bacterium]
MSPAFAYPRSQIYGETEVPFKMGMAADKRVVIRDPDFFFNQLPRLEI